MIIRLIATIATHPNKVLNTMGFTHNFPSREGKL